MKDEISYKLMKQLKNEMRGHKKSRFLKKIKYLAIFALIPIFLLGGLAVWGTFAVAKNVLSMVQQNTPIVELKEAEATLSSLVSQPITTQECINTISSMFSPVRWLTVPVAQNVKVIKLSCFSDVENSQKNSSLPQT